MSAAAQTSRTDALAGLREELAHLLGAERRLRGRDQHRTDGDLSHAQVRALFALGREDATAGEIAKVAQLSPASVTGMLDDLEERGVVARRRSGTDRRRVLVSLTDEGRGVLERRRGQWATRWERALADVPDGDLQAAERVLRAIAELFEEL